MVIKKKRILSFSLLLILSAGLTFSALPQGKRLVTHEDIVKSKGTSAVAPSPDGRRIALQIDGMDYDPANYESHLWLIDKDGSGLRQLTSDKGGESSPAWSPDGKRLAFIAQRGSDEFSQVYVLDMENGGEATRLTSVYAGVSFFQWSPDGKWIAFTSSRRLGLPDEKSNREKDQALQNEKSKARTCETFPYRIWMSWLDDKREALFLVPSAGGPEKSLTGNLQITGLSGWGGVEDWTWVPDGSGIVFTATVENDSGFEKVPTKDLYLLDLKTMTAKKLTENPHDDQAPAFSPDGKWLLYVSTSEATPAYIAGHLTAMSWPDGHVHPLCGNWDAAAKETAWSADGRAICFTAECDGTAGVWEVSLEDALAGKSPHLLAGAPGTWMGVFPMSGAILSLNGKSTQPYELFSISDKGVVSPVTRLNKERTDAIAWNEAESVSYSCEGLKIQGWLVKPPDFDPSKKYPLMCIVHGGPNGVTHDEFDFRWNLQLFAARGFVVFAPNPMGSLGFGKRFAQAVHFDWGGAAYREIMAGIDFLIKTRPFIDGARMAVGGGSYGGYMANWINGHTDRFSCAISHAGIFNLTSFVGTTDSANYQEHQLGTQPWKDFAQYEKWSPHHAAAKMKTPTLITHGEIDYRVPVGQGFELYFTLKRLGVPARLVYFPNQGHSIMNPIESRKFYEEAFAWLDRWIPREKTCPPAADPGSCCGSRQAIFPEFVFDKWGDAPSSTLR